ncbi:MAG: allantoinase PuuE [Pseudomonadota bacterium]
MPTRYDYADPLMNAYPRDMRGYAGQAPHANWPDRARVAVSFVLNIEEGGENAILHGDAASETFLSEIIGALPFDGARHMSMESIYEYGSRAGVWRILDLFRDMEMPITLFAVTMAAMRTPWIIDRAMQDGHEVACHGLRWINYHGMPEEMERQHIAEAVEKLTEVCGGVKPRGWYTGRTSENTRRLVAEHGGFLYDSDDYSDDLPFWSNEQPGQLIVPYTLDANDMRFAAPQGFNSGDQFFTYLKDSFDTLYTEGEVAPKMMSIGLHARIVGRPGRFTALKRFVEYVRGHDRVWVARREDIASHWRASQPLLG